jgi:Collagen triple helix repeat (20 copies)
MGKETVAKKVKCWKCCRFAVGAAALMLFPGVTARAQATGIITVCVRTGDGSVRMLLNNIPSPPCQAGEQFVQWNMQGAQGAKGDQGAKGPKGDKGDKGDAGKDGNDGQDGKDGNAGNAGKQGPPGPPGPQGPPGPTTVTGRTGGSSGPFYAPFKVLSKDGKTILEVDSAAMGPRLELFGQDGKTGIAVLGAGTSTPNGTLLLRNTDHNKLIALGVDGYGAPRMEMDEGEQKIAELAPGKLGTMGLRIWNESHNEVVTLEAIRPGEDTTGGGGLMIHNYTGGVAATIAPNRFGVGIYHGITAVMPVNHP